MAAEIKTKTGNITKERACAIVNAANSSLMGGGGVDGAIHDAAGPELWDACMKIRETEYPDGLPVSEAVVTPAGDLPARYVIHTVGPIYGRCGDACEELLANAYRNALQKAWELGCRDIVFPAISTGIYGYPKEEAARIAYRTAADFIQKHPISVTFIFHNPLDEEIFRKVNKLTKN